MKIIILLEMCIRDRCEIETLICKLTPEDFNEIFKRKNDRTENSLKETFSALSNCSITFDTVTRDGVRAKMIASLISHFYIEKETGNYQVVVPAKLYKYLFDLGLGHTQNALQVIYRLKGIYAQRSVSYTHLDVYKRQIIIFRFNNITISRRIYNKS